MTAGAIAPFSGVLLSDASIAKILVDNNLKIEKAELEIAILKKQLELEKRKMENTCQIKINGERIKYVACLKENDKLQSIIKKSVKPPWYKSPYLHFAAGNILAGGICVTILAR